MALKAAALKLVNSLAGSQHAAAFQAAVTQSPQSAKQRLQVRGTHCCEQGSMHSRPLSNQ